MNMNALKQWMDMYNQQGMGPHDNSSGGFQPTHWDRQGLAADWAMKMMQEQPGSAQASGAQPGYQPYQGPQYVKPDYMNRPQQSPQSMQNRGDPMMQGRDYGMQLEAKKYNRDNVLSQLLGSMNGLR